MNLQNKSEFKRFVKDKLRSGECVSISMYCTKYGENKPLWHIVSLYPRNEYVTSYRIVKSKSGQMAKSKFNKYNQWLTDCEDEVYIHFRQTVFSHIECNKELKSKDKYKRTCYSSGVTCKRCLAEMEAGK